VKFGVLQLSLTGRELETQPYERI